MKADIDLVKEVKAGNRSAFSELVERHQKSIYRLALRFTRDHGTAEDIVQESFVKAYQKLNLFEERSSFKSWLFRIAINSSKNKIRGNRSNTTVDIENVVVSVSSVTESNMEYREAQGIIHSEVEKLPYRQRVALTLRVYEDMSFQEIAKIMDCPYDTAKANYRHAILKLRKVLPLQNFSMNEDWLTHGVEVKNSTIQSEPTGD